MVVSEQVTTLEQPLEQDVTDASVPARGPRRLTERIRAIALGAGFPLVLILLWDRAVAITGTRLVPSLREVRGDDVRFFLRRNLRRRVQRDHSHPYLEI